MFPKPKPALSPNTYAFESEPMVKPTGFREYDARWLFGKEINLMGMQALGMGLGTLIQELGAKPEIVTGHDFRSYSASIKYALISGLLAAGCKVHDIGLVREHRVADRVQHLHVFGIGIVFGKRVVELGIERNHFASDRFHHLGSESACSAVTAGNNDLQLAFEFGSFCQIGDVARWKILMKAV